MSGPNVRAVGVVALVATALALAPPGAAANDAAGERERSARSAGVTRWIGVLLDEIARRPLSPPRVARALA